MYLTNRVTRRQRRVTSRTRNYKAYPDAEITSFCCLQQALYVIVWRSGFQCSSKKEEDCRAVSSDVPCWFAISGHWSDRSSIESVTTCAPLQKAWEQGQATQLKYLWGNTDLRTVIITKKASKRS
ncbi:hypothetical protein DPX16_19720 [Anabarilius grahami]|uniref:Uncharacterized protein n=1 Tax=Anabarilius grahami TaxID=495550 RepID=A0A3N0XQ29_ANAGA|nr:hypothetical protein DPX16_19720 [Anabarilius grahami]